jgi:DNA-binding GntR family transcriptional regulator
MDESAADRLVDDVYRRLRDDIVAGTLAPGERLSVPALAAQLQVSRSPVRDAVARLVQERLATEAPRRGAVVARVGVRELSALYEVREVLEGLAARLAVDNVGQRLVRSLAAVMAEHEAAVATGDLARHFQLDLRFHSLIREAAGNAELTRFLDDIQIQVRLAMQTTSVTGGPERALDDHRAILAAIDAGDGLAAERASRDHIIRLRDALNASAIAPVR